MRRPRRVFLSYASRDRHLAESLEKDLAKAGFTVWSDQQLLPGDNWAREVGRALDESDAMVVIVSPAAARSESVRRDVEFALGSQKYARRLIPVVAKPTNEMPWIDRLQQVRMNKNPAEVSQRVIEALETP